MCGSHYNLLLTTRRPFRSERNTIAMRRHNFRSLRSASRHHARTQSPPGPDLASLSIVCAGLAVVHSRDGLVVQHQAVVHARQHHLPRRPPPRPARSAWPACGTTWLHMRSGGVPKAFQRRSRGVPEAFQKRSRGVPEAFQRRSRSVPEAFRRRSRSVPEAFQRRFRRFQA